MSLAPRRMQSVTGKCLYGEALSGVGYQRQPTGWGKAFPRRRRCRRHSLLSGEPLYQFDGGSRCIMIRIGPVG
jgi:hypothetical protein